MPRYIVRARETRVHVLYIDADDADQAREFAAGMDGSNSVQDSFDEWEVMDVDEETASAPSPAHRGDAA